LAHSSSTVSPSLSLRLVASPRLASPRLASPRLPSPPPHPTVPRGKTWGAYPNGSVRPPFPVSARGQGVGVGRRLTTAPRVHRSGRRALRDGSIPSRRPVSRHLKWPHDDLSTATVFPSTTHNLSFLVSCSPLSPPPPPPSSSSRLQRPGPCRRSRLSALLRLSSTSVPSSAS
jgi:hypothetical protein